MSHDPTATPPDDTSFTPIHETEPQSEDARPPIGIEQLAQQIKETADKLLRDNANRGDVKLLSTALRELRYSFKVFSAYKHRRKVTVFGSARTPAGTPLYETAVEFGRKAAAAGYMVITGAAAGIMEAGHVGAGRANSMGLNIILPFEQKANPVILGDHKLMHLKYFFTRKLLFLKESDAVALFPGGFGTHDEGFEVLTLIQTGKSHLFPVVLVDEPGGNYWDKWLEFVEGVMLPRGYISPADRSLYKRVDSVEAGVAEVDRFYRVYHSMRYVRGELVLRLQKPLPESLLRRLHREYADIVVGDGGFRQTGPLPSEANEPNLNHLTRLCFRFERHAIGRLRQLIDTINDEA